MTPNDRAALPELLHWLPLAPIAIRLVILGGLWPQYMREPLREAERDLDTHRSIAQHYAGLSMAGVLAIAVLEPAALHRLGSALYFLALSFLFFFGALHFVGYAFRRWALCIGVAGLIDGATFCLILAMGLGALTAGVPYARTLAIVGGGIWLSDFLARIVLLGRWLHARDRRDGGAPAVGA